MTGQTGPLSGAKVVLGGIGDDIHVVALKILERTLTDAGAEVNQLGVMTPPEEFVAAAADAHADAIWISSSNGHAEFWCEGLRDSLEEAGISGVRLYIGGNLAVGQREWADVERRFGALGFDRVYPPGTDPQQAIADLAEDLAAAPERTP
jgi:methylaspartate mutase sigma subunit